LTPLGQGTFHAHSIDLSSAQDRTGGFSPVQPLPMRFPSPFFSIGKATQNLWIPIASRHRASGRTKPHRT
jgi:hypothetical protein